ncbi:hypothetical protein D3C81_934040 [compost metagenome]
MDLAIVSGERRGVLQPDPTRIRRAPYHQVAACADAHPRITRYQDHATAGRSGAGTEQIVGSGFPGVLLELLDAILQVDRTRSSAGQLCRTP